jgi:aspartate carbamoyltransferase regulatory subunit
MEEPRKELQVAAIERGTSIDHIPPEHLFKVALILGLDKMSSNTITIGNNLRSKKMGKKGMIKISGAPFRRDELEKIALIAPGAVINEIDNYQVKKKYVVVVPDEVENLIRCNNPRCITNNEPMNTFFSVIDKVRGTVKCRYCERKINREDIILI